MAITALPLPTPDATMPEADFDAAANAFLSALPTFATEANAQAVTINASQVTASAAAGTATTQAGIATTQAGLALTRANTATTQAGEASTSANTATTQAGIATTKAGEASTSATNAAGSLFTLNTKFLGAKSSDPTLDNNGNALVNGAWYDNTTTASPRIRRGGAWVDAVFDPSGALVASANLSDLGSAATARGNLGLGTAALAATGDFATAAQGANGVTAYSWGNHASAGYLTGIANDSVDNTKLANMATARIKGRNTAGTGDPEDLTGAQVLGIVGTSTASEIAGLSGDKPMTPSNVGSMMGVDTPSGGSNFTPNFATKRVAKWTPTANRVLSNPSNGIPGVTYAVEIYASTATERTITFGNQYVGDLPEIKVTDTVGFMVFIYCVGSTKFIATAVALQ